MAEEQAPKKNFGIQKLYIKDVSFESPDSPQVFNFTQWEPKIELNINNSHKQIDDNHWEVVVTVTVTAKLNDKTAFLVEVQQAGIFVMSGFSDDEKGYIVGSQCMTILFPYAREAISDLTTRGGFPPMILTPVNFEALYQQHIKKKAGDSEEVKH
ncbi:MAG: preprotein translocase subunit SecB [Gammaproteobacteria bacterium]|jgi:preprotein translocase subunit SecB